MAGRECIDTGKKDTRMATMTPAEEFLHHLGRDLNDEERLIVAYAKEATVQTDATGKKINAGFWPVPYRDGKFIDTNSNCYVGISSVIKTPNPKTGQMRYWRGESNFSAGLCLFVDDIGNGRGSKGGLLISDLADVLPPTAVIESSPQNFQLFYFLDEPERDMKRFKTFLISFVNKVLGKGGDSTIRDVARVGRMPCGYNNKKVEGELKYPDEKGKPFQVRLESANYDLRYSIDQIAKAFEFQVIVPVQKIVHVDERELGMDAYWYMLAERIMGAAKMGEGSSGEVVMNMSGKVRIRCPWGDEHTNGDPFGAYFRGPIPGAEFSYVFGCGHDSCRKTNKRTWSTFVDEIVIKWIVEKLEQANASAPTFD